MLPSDVTKTMKLTLFYDGYCPLCKSEMAKLEALDQRDHLAFEDIQSPGFSLRYPNIDVPEANRILHAQYEDGSMIYGLDVTHQAWRLVGRHRWLALLRLPIIRWFADFGYLVFARHRYTISYWFTGQRRCESCSTSGRK